MTMTAQPEATARDRLYKARVGKPELIRVPEMGFVMIDGRGDPNSAPAYAEAIQALYSLSYTLKFALKKSDDVQYRMGPLEGLWWAEDMTRFGLADKSDWSWTMMIAQPDAVTDEHVARARAEVARKRELPGLDLAHLTRFEEGLSAQVLHVGPFSAEAPTIAALHAFIHDQGFEFDGRQHKHHEIYLSDPRRGAPEKWKTIVRQPVAQ